MSFIMNHDITSLIGQRIMQKNSLAMRRSLQKLSSGMRLKITDVDNTASLAISETMRSRIFSAEKALQNTQDGISLIQTALGGLEQTQGMMNRMRELTVQAANDVLTQQDRSYVQVEINELRKEITRLANTTQFNRKKILSGDNAVLWSSNNSEVKAIINGGIRSIDQFGQKYAVDGNYNINVRAKEGQAQAQKSDIFRIKSGEVATGDTKLQDIDKFWNSEGKFLLEQPKELTLTQGDGTQARITLYADDTLNSIASKLNNAVAASLGQAKYADDASKFVTFTDSANAQDSGLDSVAGTLVIRSALTGKRGEITLSGSEDLLNAFSLNTIQEAQETDYILTITDAHDNSVIAQNVKATGNRVSGVIHRNIDVELDPMMGLQAKYDSSSGAFRITNTTGDTGTDVTLHLSDNSSIFQTGSGEGEDVILSIGDMSSHALGLDSVNVMSRGRAVNSIGVIDKAIDHVSMQMASLGGSENRLEHHLAHLSSEIESIIGANSNIRDLDYAKEIMEFAKMQILASTNAAMLAQSNQMQQNSILGLFR